MPKNFTTPKKVEVATEHTHDEVFQMGTATRDGWLFAVAAFSDGTSSDEPPEGAGPECYPFEVFVEVIGALEGGATDRARRSSLASIRAAFVEKGVPPDTTDEDGDEYECAIAPCWADVGDADCFAWLCEQAEDAGCFDEALRYHNEVVSKD